MNVSCKLLSDEIGNKEFNAFIRFFFNLLYFILYFFNLFYRKFVVRPNKGDKEYYRMS